MESYTSSRVRLLNHSPTREARRAVIQRVEPEYDYGDSSFHMRLHNAFLHTLYMNPSSRILIACAHNLQSKYKAAYIFLQLCHVAGGNEMIYVVFTV